MPLAGALAALEFGILVGRTKVVQVHRGGRTTARLGLASLSAPADAICADRAVALLCTLCLRVVASAVYAHGLQAHWRTWEGSAPGNCPTPSYRLWWSAKLLLGLSQCLRELVLTVWPALAPMHYLQHALLAHRVALATVVASLVGPEDDTWQGMNLLSAAGHGLRTIMNQDDVAEFARQAGGICVSGFIGHAWSLAQHAQPAAAAARHAGVNMASVSQWMAGHSSSSAVDWPEETLRFLALYLALMLVYMAYTKLQGPAANQYAAARLRLHNNKPLTCQATESATECESTTTDHILKVPVASKQPSCTRHRFSDSTVVSNMPQQLPHTMSRISPAAKPAAMPAVQPTFGDSTCSGMYQSADAHIDAPQPVQASGRRFSMPLMCEPPLTQPIQKSGSTRRASAMAQLEAACIPDAGIPLPSLQPSASMPHVLSMGKLACLRASVSSQGTTNHAPHRQCTGRMSRAVSITRQTTLHPLFLAEVVVVRLTGMAIFAAYSCMTLHHLLTHKAAYGTKAAWQLAFKIWPSTYLAPIAVLVQVAALMLVLAKQPVYMKHHTTISNVVYFGPLAIRLLMLVAEPAGSHALGHVVTSLNPSTFIYFALSSLVRKDTWARHILLLVGTGLVLLTMKASVLGMLPTISFVQPASIASWLTALFRILQNHPSYMTVALVASLLHALLAQQPMTRTIRQARQRVFSRLRSSGQASPVILPQLHEAPSGEVEGSASSHSSRSASMLLHFKGQHAAAGSMGDSSASTAVQHAEDAMVAGLLSAAVSSHVQGVMHASGRRPPRAASRQDVHCERMRRHSEDMMGPSLERLEAEVQHVLFDQQARQDSLQHAAHHLNGSKSLSSFKEKDLDPGHQDSSMLQHDTSVHVSDAAVELLDSMVLDDPFKALDHDVLVCDAKDSGEEALPGLSGPVTVLQEVLTEHPLSPQLRTSENRDRLVSEAGSHAARPAMRPTPSDRRTNSGRQSLDMPRAALNWGSLFMTGWWHWGQQSVDMVGATLLLLLRMYAAAESLLELKAAANGRHAAAQHTHNYPTTTAAAYIGEVASTSTKARLGSPTFHPLAFPLLSQAIAISYSMAMLYGIVHGTRFFRQHRTKLWIGQLLGMAVLQQLALHATHSIETAGQPRVPHTNWSHDVPAYLSHPVLSMVCMSVMWPLLGLELGTYKVTLLIRLVLTLILACSFLLRTCLAEPELMGLMSLCMLLVMVAAYAISHEALCAAPRMVNRMAAVHKLNKQQPTPTSRLLLALLRTQQRTACALQALLLGLLLLPCSHTAAASLLSLDSPTIAAIRDTCHAILMRLLAQPMAPLNTAASSDTSTNTGNVSSSSSSNEFVLIPAELVEPLGLVLLAVVAVAMLQALDLVTASDVQRDHWYQEQLRTLQALTEMRLDLLTADELVQELQEQLPGLFTGSMACMVLINYDQEQPLVQSEDGAPPPVNIQARAATLAALPKSMPKELPSDCVALLASMLIRGQSQSTTFRDVVAEAANQGPHRRDAKRLQRHFTDMHVSSVTLVPLVTDGVVCGGLVALSPEPNAHDQQLLDVLHGLAALLSSVMLLSHALHEARMGDLIIADVMPPQVAEQLKRQVVGKTQQLFPATATLNPSLSRSLHQSFAGIAKGLRSVPSEPTYPYSLCVQPSVSLGGSDSGTSRMAARTDAAAVVSVHVGHGSPTLQGNAQLAQALAADSAHLSQCDSAMDAHCVPPAQQEPTHSVLRGRSALRAASKHLRFGSGASPEHSSRLSTQRHISSDGEAAVDHGPFARLLLARTAHEHSHSRSSFDITREGQISNPTGSEEPVRSAPLPERLSLPGQSNVAGSMRRTVLGLGEQSAPGIPSATGQQLVYKQWHDSVTVLFCDIVGYTSMSQELEPEQVMLLLHELFTKYDKLADKWGVYKVETIGDCYMACTGVTRPDPQHAETLLSFAVDMVHAANSVSNPLTGGNVSVRVGLHSGRVMSGIVGMQRARYCLFGDTVNTASRMESTGMANHLQISEATFKLLPPEKQDLFMCRGEVQVKGKGNMLTFLLDPCNLDMSNLDISQPSARLLHVPAATRQQ